MATAAAGWYIDPDDRSRQRWWFGRAWSNQTAPLEEGTPELPARGRVPVPEASSGHTRSSGTRSTTAVSGMQNAGIWMNVLAALSALGAVIGAVLFIAHTAPHCVANPYNDALGVDLQDCTDRHPWVVSGITVGVVGLIQAAVLLVIARLCFAVDQLRRSQQPAA